MSRLIWGAVGERKYETGVKQCVLYPKSDAGIYPKGVAWNGVTKVGEKPSGAESNPIYADDSVYADIRSSEKFGATIEAYMSPKEFDACDGTAEVAPGVSIGQQTRKGFGLCYRTVLGNDARLSEYGYILHLIYDATAAPTEKEYSTISESTDPATLSWEIATTPVEVPGFKRTAHLKINSTTIDAAKLTALEDILYGKDLVEARLPLPSEIITLVGTGGAG